MNARNLPPPQSADERDALLMRMAEALRQAGARPAQRVAWAEYVEKSKRSELHA